jgi:internalin A
MPVKVFVSSTYVDLKDHRRQVIDQLRRAGYHVDPMEDWTSDADEPTRFSVERLRGCAACVLLVGFRRGFVPPEQARSITQLEYDRATDRGIDVLPFLLDEHVTAWPAEYDDRGRDPGLQAWRDHLGLHHGVQRFTPDSGSIDVLAALSRWTARRHERDRVRDYLASVSIAHGVIRFLGLPALKDTRNIPIDRLFVEPALSPHPISPESEPTDWRGRRPLIDAVARDDRLVILGDPGSGKSTLVDWLAWRLADEHPNQWKARLGNRIPIPLILRDLHVREGITWDGLIDAFIGRPVGKHLSREYLIGLLEDGHALVLLDGLDEIGNLHVRRDLRDAVLTGFRRFTRSPFLLTSRIVGYHDVPFHDDGHSGRRSRTGATALAPSGPVALAYVTPFDDDQILEFAHNWHAEREADVDQARAGTGLFVQAVHRNRDTLRLARVPNLLTMMALVHRHRAALPNGRALLYEDICEAYLKTIDAFRGISEYTHSLQDMKQWLGRVAFELQRTRAAATGNEGILVDEQTLDGWLSDAMRGAGSPHASGDVARFVDVIRRRSGLIVERGENQFAFTHLSFQDYFAAVYLANWVTSAEWLTGEEVPPGTSAADLQQYAHQYRWHEALVFLFELLAATTPLGRKKVREAIFGQNWSGVIGRDTVRDMGLPDAAILLARLTSDPHVNWGSDIQAAAVERCLDVVAGYHVDDDGTRLYEVVPSILKPLLSGEGVQVFARLQRLAERWRADRIPRLSLFGTPVSDLSPLAGLTWLTALHLIGAPVADLGPLAGMTRLTTLRLDGTRVTDLSPLAGLTNLETLDLPRTPVADLRPLARLTRLEILNLDETQVLDLSPLYGLTALRGLSISSTKVSANDVAKLKAAVPALDVYRPW